MIWFVEDLARFGRERDAISELEQQVDWLTVNGWEFDSETRLCVSMDIRTAARKVELRLHYSHNFPFTPPSVRPRKPERLSSHQYGTGELCLEHGPDNWHFELTGADSLRSAYRLLSAEAAAPPGEAGDVPSRHVTTRGQDLRGARLRLLTTESLVRALAAAPRGKTARVQFTDVGRNETFVIVPTEITGFDDAPWVDAELPAPLKRFAYKWNGLAFTMPTGGSLPTIISHADLSALLVAHGFQRPSDFSPDFVDLLLLYGDFGLRLLRLEPDGVTVTEVPALDVARTQGRLDDGYAGLRPKKVALVGCGSVGSKIATTLARAGVSEFVLVDDDVLVPDNLVRNDLDWTSVGEHKVEAIARRIANVNPGANCDIRRQKLTGQESASAADALLTTLRGCDVIVDATAAPEVLNLISQLVAADPVPVVWTQVFAGGIGGFVARSRPGHDPPPQFVRKHFEAWCAERGTPAPVASTDYESRDEGGTLIADDGEVTILAAHAARFVIDILLDRRPSWFPVSLYVIGLTRSWIFQEPFHTFPIDVGPPPEPPAPIPLNPDHFEAIKALVEGLRARVAPES